MSAAAAEQFAALVAPQSRQTSTGHSAAKNQVNKSRDRDPVDDASDALCDKTKAQVL